MTSRKTAPIAAPSFQSRVEAAALLLIREGRQPTIAAVRERMGGASPNLVGPALRVWREGFGRALAQMSLNDAPVPSIVLELASVLWSAALAEAEQRQANPASQRSETQADTLVRQLATLVKRLQTREARYITMSPARHPQKRERNESRRVLSHRSPARVRPRKKQPGPGSLQRSTGKRIAARQRNLRARRKRPTSPRRSP
jgi:hypothetical protein